MDDDGAERDRQDAVPTTGDDLTDGGAPSDGDDLGLEANEELRIGDASMNADRGEG